MATLMPEQDLLSRALTVDEPTHLLAQLDEILKTMPDDPIALAARAIVLRRSGDKPGQADVMPSLIKAAEDARDDLATWHQIARAIHSTGLDDRFLDEMKGRAGGVDSTPTDWRLLGKFQFYLDRNDDAVASLTEATKRDPSSDLTWYELALAAVDAQKPEIAIEAIAQMVRLDPESESVPLLIGLKIAALSINRPLEALELWRAHELPLDLFEIQRRAIQLAEGLLKIAPVHTKEAIEVIKRIEPQLTPSTRWPALRAEAQALIIDGQYQEALALLDSVDAVVEDPQDKAGVRFWQAVALERSGRVEEGLSHIDEALKLQQSEGDAAAIHLVRARLLNHKAEYQQALNDLALVNPRLLPVEFVAEFSLHKGIALVSVGEYEAAREPLDQAITQSQNSPLLPLILFWRGRALAGAKQFEEALNSFAAARESGFPQSESVALDIVEALAWSGLGKNDVALEKLDHAIEATSNKTVAGQLLMSKSRLLGLQKEVKGAYAAIDSAIAMSPDKPDAGIIALEKAAIAQAAGPEYMTDALENADAALAALPETDSTNAPRVQALGIRFWALRNKGDYAGALATIQRIEKIEPDARNELDFISGYCETLWILGKGADALSLLQDEINGQSKIAGHPFLHLLLGESARRMGDVDKYFAELANATKVPPQHANETRAWQAAALAATAIRHFDEANDAINHLEILDKPFFESPTGQVLRAQLLVGKGEFQAALDLLPESIKLIGPLKIMALQSRAFALSGLGQFSQAVSALDQLVALVSGSPEIGSELLVFALSMKATFLIRMDQPKAALAVLGEIDKLQPGTGLAQLGHLVASITKAMVLNRLGENDEALAKINDAIQAEQACANLPAGLIEPGRTIWIKGMILFELSREEEALRAFEQAQLAGLAGNEALVWQGRALLALEDPDRAREVFDLAIKEATDRQDPTQLFEALIGKGRALHDAHTYEAAVVAYRQALRAGGDSAEANALYWSRLGESYYALGRFEAALRAFRRGQQIEDNANLARGVSATLIRQKRYREAEEAASQLASKDPPLNYNRGLALWALGKKDQAKVIINEASEAGVIEATQFARELQRKRNGAEGWWETWFGAEVSRTRSIVGICLLLAVASALTAPVFAYSQNALDWKASLVPAAVALVLLLIPSIKGLSLGTEGVKLEIEPSALADAGETLKIDPLPLGSFIVASSLQSLRKPERALRRVDPDDPSLRVLSSLTQLTELTVLMRK